MEVKFDKTVEIDYKIVIKKKSTKFKKMSPRPLYPNQPSPKRKKGRNKRREEGKEERRKEDR